jgi:hypothetical protein
VVLKQDLKGNAQNRYMGLFVFILLICAVEITGLFIAVGLLPYPSKLR